jgi:hypothetical protein
VIGEPAIASIENTRNIGEFRGEEQRVGPPDLPSEVNDRLRSAVDLTGGGGYAHFPQQILWRQGQQGLRTWVLQRGEAEAAGFERAAKTARQRGADAAVAVEENPAGFLLCQSFLN